MPFYTSLSLFTRFVALLSLSVCSFAVTINLAPIEPVAKSKPVIRDLMWMNETYLNNQRKIADDLTRKHFGRQLHQNKRDLPLIQRLINEGYLEGADKQTLQAFGVAMGDVFAKYHRKLKWKVYEDELGASHAVCLDKTEQCIFTMTILSRRMEAGLKPNVEKIYQDTITSMKPHFPHVPYSRDQ